MESEKNDRRATGKPRTGIWRFVPESRPWRLALMTLAMTLVVVVVTMYGRESGSWPGGGLGETDTSAGVAEDSGGDLSGGGDRALDDLSEGESGSTSPAGSSGPADSGSRSGATVSGSPASGSGSASEQSAVPVTQKPPVSSSPSAPDRPEDYLDEAFGEAMFPDDLFSGLSLVEVFEYDESEVTATYKSEGAYDFDIVRMTVQRAESSAKAGAALVEVAALFPAERLEYEWGGRLITQRASANSGSAPEPSLNLSWLQGKYAIDVTIHPPYRNGVANGRQAVLDLIGRMRY